MKHTKQLLWMLLPLLLIVLSGVAAQDGGQCAALIEAAITAAQEICQDVGSDEVCLGHTGVTATARDGATLTFAQPGDRAALADVAALHSTGLDEEAGTWGVAVMRLRAEQPDIHVTLIAFGDITIENEGGAATPPSTLTATASSNANLRGSPSTNGAIVGGLATGETITLDGRLADGSWLRLRAEDGPAWVFATLVSVEGDVSTLAVVEPGQEAAPGTAYGPMQAFSLSGGTGRPPCEGEPPGGVLVQTPEDAGPVLLSVNGMGVVFGSTAYLTTAEQMNGSDLLEEASRGSGLAQVANGAGIGIALFKGNVTYPGHKAPLFPGQAQILQTDDLGGTVLSPPVNYNAMTLYSVPTKLLPERVDIPQREMLNVGGHDIVTFCYLPPPDVPGSDTMAIFTHGARLNMSSWDWVVPSLLDQGIHVVTPDMPGHGQTGGGDPAWDDWPGILIGLADYHRTMYGTNSFVFGGSSIGADAAALACLARSGSCVGAALFSPGNYLGWGVATVLQALGDTPVFIATAENDPAGAPGPVGRALAANAANATLYIYPGTTLHGSDLYLETPVESDFMAWFTSQVIPRPQPSGGGGQLPTVTPSPTPGG